MKRPTLTIFTRTEDGATCAVLRDVGGRILWGIYDIDEAAADLAEKSEFRDADDAILDAEVIDLRG